MLITTVLYCLQAILSVILEEVWRPTQTELDSFSWGHHDPLGVAFWVPQWQPLGSPAFGLQGLTLIWSILALPTPGISTVGACWNFLCSPNDLSKVDTWQEFNSYYTEERMARLTDLWVWCMLSAWLSTGHLSSLSYGFLFNKVETKTPSSKDGY